MGVLFFFATIHWPWHLGVENIVAHFILLLFVQQPTVFVFCIPVRIHLETAQYHSLQLSEYLNLICRFSKYLAISYNKAIIYNRFISDLVWIRAAKSMNQGDNFLKHTWRHCVSIFGIIIGHLSFGGCDFNYFVKSQPSPHNIYFLLEWYYLTLSSMCGDFTHFATTQPTTNIFYWGVLFALHFHLGVVTLQLCQHSRLFVR